MGGVTAATHETALLCAAAGYDIILIETVGVGQSEWLVSEMVDAFVLLMLPNAGDELQGIKRGIFELADIIAVNKADGDQEAQAREASRAYSAAMRYGSHDREEMPPILTTSGLHGSGLDTLWKALHTVLPTEPTMGGLQLNASLLPPRALNGPLIRLRESFSRSQMHSQPYEKGSMKS